MGDVPITKKDLDKGDLCKHVLGSKMTSLFLLWWKASLKVVITVPCWPRRHIYYADRCSR